MQYRSKDAWCTQSAQIQDPPTLSSVDHAHPRLPPRAPPLSVPLLVQAFPCRQPFRPPARPPASRLLSYPTTRLGDPLPGSMEAASQACSACTRQVRAEFDPPLELCGSRPLPAVAVCPIPSDTDTEIIRACRVHQVSGDPLTPAAPAPL
ncbi:hypothetical protein B0H14DRAFT_1535856 [Mycena olivaceomarginata]|nr:hypothetical protein B0H14DRAFT_1535856 [Mycena olivaceomarginata]